MSFTATNWAWDQACPSSAAKLVLVCLADHANKTGERAFPSIPTICKRTQLVERTVRKALADLISCGLIHRHDRKSGRQQLSAEYRLIMRETPPANLQGPTPDAPPANLPDPPANMQGDLIPDPPAYLPKPPCKSARESKKEPKKGRKKESSASLTIAPTDGMLKQLWEEGLAIAERLRKRSDPSANVIVGRLLNIAAGDAEAVLHALNQATKTPPLHLLSWCIRVIQNRVDPLPPRQPDPNRIYGAAGAAMKLRRERDEARAREALSC